MATNPKYALRGTDPSASPTHWKKRIRGVTWATYTSVMGTNGAAYLIYELPYDVTWKLVLSKIIYIFNLVLFTVLTVCIITRFCMYPRALKSSFLHPVESAFIPCFPLALATLTSNAISLGGPSTGYWLATVCVVLFFVYCTLSCLCAIFVPILQWHKQSHTIDKFMPAAILPPMGVVFAGALAYSITERTPEYTSIYIIIVGHVIMSIGVFTGLIYDAYFTMRMLHGGMIAPEQAPTMLIQVGPIAWAAYGFIGLGYRASTVFPAHMPQFAQNAMSGSIFEVTGIYLGLMLWALSWWLTLTSYVWILTCFWRRKFAWSVVHWGLTFPVAGLISTTLILGQRLDSGFLRTLGTVKVVIWLISWLWALFASIVGICKGEIFAEGKDQNAPTPDYLGEFYRVESDKSATEEGRTDSPRGNGHVTRNAQTVRERGVASQSHV